MTDAELVQAARANDPQAWQTLCRRYLPLVWRSACAQLEDVHAAEDVASEAMLAFLKGIDTIDAESPRISAWLRSVVRHKIADHHRRVYRSKNVMPQLRYEHQHTNGALRPEQLVERSEIQESIVEVLNKLSERQRLALEWKYVEGLRVREIAGRLGETEKAVEATLYRARREFRRLYHFAMTSPDRTSSDSSPPDLSSDLSSTEVSSVPAPVDVPHK